MVPRPAGRAAPGRRLLRAQSLREELAPVAFVAAMTSATDPTLAPGSRLAHYEIRDVLGSGAMGTVYRSYDTALDRDVAVKVLRARLAQDPAVVERFVREARAAARVNHPNLTHVYFVGSELGCQFPPDAGTALESGAGSARSARWWERWLWCACPMNHS